MTSRIRELAELPAGWWRTVPALAPLLALLGGVVPAVALAAGYLGPWPAALVVLAAGGMLFAVLPGRWRWALLLLPVGVGLSFLNAAAPWRTYERLLPRPNCYAEVRAVVVESRLPGWRLRGLVETPGTAVARVDAVRLAREDTWQMAAGRILLRGADGCVYGDHVELRGTFVRPPAPWPPGGFDYRTYLRSRGIAHLFVVDGLTVTGGASGWRRWLRPLWGLRDAVAERTLRGIDDPADRRLLAAMTMGLRESLDPDERETYLRSGMIHLLAISGLHVGVLYVLLMWLLGAARVPFRARHVVAPVLLLVYVLATGAAASAMRAWLMLTVWSLGRASLRPVIGLNAVFLAVLLLVLWSPFTVVQTGFQFSFVVVLCLVGSWRQARVLLHSALERQQWRPLPHRSRWWAGRLRLLLRGLLAVTVAWLGSSGLTAWHNGLFVPGSLLANLGAGLLAWPILVLSVLKVVLPVAALARAQEVFLHALRVLAATTAGGGAVSVPRPSLALVVLYYAAVAVLLLAATRPRRLLATAVPVVALLLAIGAGIWPAERFATVTVMVPAGQTVPVLVARTATGVCLVNVGPRGFAAPLAAWLHRRGVTAVDRIALLDGSAAAAGGMDALRDQLQPTAPWPVAEQPPFVPGDPDHHRLDLGTAVVEVISREPVDAEVRVAAPGDREASWALRYRRANRPRLYSW